MVKCQLTSCCGNVESCEYKPGDKVLVLLSFRRNPLQAKYYRPYKVLKMVNDLVYIVELHIGEKLAKGDLSPRSCCKR